MSDDLNCAFNLDFLNYKKVCLLELKQMQGIADAIYFFSSFHSNPTYKSVMMAFIQKTPGLLMSLDVIHNYKT